MDVLFNFLASFSGGWIPVELALLMALIVVDVGLGAAAAIRLGVFDLETLARFYTGSVLPYVLGWITFVLAAAFISQYAVDQLASIPAVADALELLSPASVHAAYAVIVVAMLKSIYRNGKELYEGQWWNDPNDPRTMELAGAQPVESPQDPAE